MLKYNAVYKDVDVVSSLGVLEKDYTYRVNFDVVKNSKGEKTLAFCWCVGDDKQVIMMTRDEAIDFIKNTAEVLEIE